VRFDSAMVTSGQTASRISSFVTSCSGLLTSRTSRSKAFAVSSIGKAHSPKMRLSSGSKV
jgi:hypothetical protein